MTRVFSLLARVARPFSDSLVGEYMEFQSQYLKLYDALSDTETNAKLLKKINIWTLHFAVGTYTTVLFFYPKDKASLHYLKNYLDKYRRRVSLLEYIAGVSFRACVKLILVCFFPPLAKPIWLLWLKAKHLLKKC